MCYTYGTATTVVAISIKWGCKLYNLCTVKIPLDLSGTQNISQQFNMSRGVYIMVCSVSNY